MPTLRSKKMRFHWKTLAVIGQQIILRHLKGIAIVTRFHPFKFQCKVYRQEMFHLSRTLLSLLLMSDMLRFFNHKEKKLSFRHIFCRAASFYNEVCHLSSEHRKWSLKSTQSSALSIPYYRLPVLPLHLVPSWRARPSFWSISFPALDVINEHRTSTIVRGAAQQSAHGIIPCAFPAGKKHVFGMWSIVRLCSLLFQMVFK